MNTKLFAFILVSSVLTVSCNENMTAKKPTVDKADAVASVNGVYISKSHLDVMKKEVAQNPRGPQMPDDQLLERLIQSELLVQEAKKKKLQEKADFVVRMELMGNALLSQVAVQDYIDSNPPTDEELKAEYDKQFGKISGEEYKGRHILLKTEDEAKAVIVALDNGGDFVALAKEKSTGPSASKGGDLGWFDSKRMVAPFSAAVAALENGKYTSEPVKTQFGWHVILREDSRTKTAPAFEDVKEHFVPMLRNQKVAKYLQSLRDQATVEILLAKKEVKAEAGEQSALPEGIEIEKVVTKEAAPDSKPAEKTTADDAATEDKPAETSTDDTAATEEKPVKTAADNVAAKEETSAKASAEDTKE